MTTGTCTNPRCTCAPCLCGEDCRCGGGRLGDLERRVMDVLWGGAGNEVTARQVADALGEYAYTTVATVLNRLSRKGAVRRRLDGRTTMFAPVGTAADRAVAVMVDALGGSGDRQQALAAFAGAVTDEDRAALLQALGGAAPPARRDGTE